MKLEGRKAKHTWPEGKTIEGVLHRDRSGVWWLHTKREKREKYEVDFDAIKHVEKMASKASSESDVLVIPRWEEIHK